jgi:hypothetical protein
MRALILPEQRRIFEMQSCFLARFADDRFGGALART